MSFHHGVFALQVDRGKPNGLLGFGSCEKEKTLQMKTNLTSQDWSIKIPRSRNRYFNTYLLHTA